VSRRELTLASAALVAALALAGCGLGAGATPSDVSLLVTANFGDQTLLVRPAAKVSGADTVMRMLERNAPRVSTLYSGGFVQSIDGLSGGGASDWFYYVNGVQAPKGAAETKLHAHDHVWWDRHPWSQAESIPAVVGSFPEPFADGYAGKRWPLRIECTLRSQKPCNAVQSVFAHYGLVASEGCLLCSQYNQTLRVVVGPYTTLSPDPAAALLAKAPGASGVYARFEDHGTHIALLDPRGHTVRTLGAGAGLIAAVRYHGQPPVWYVTGTDAAGVRAAITAFNAATLDGHFAVAVAAGAAIPLPTATS
jgi:hypothetical protein